MPTPKSKRDKVLKSSVGAATASNLSITMDASFSTALTGTVITYEDNSISSDENTKYKLVFADAAGNSVGAITLNLVGDPAPASGTTVSTVLANYTFDPSGTSGTVTMISAPAHSFERLWSQNVRNRHSVEVVDNSAKIDMRVEAAAGHAVTQTVTTQTNTQLVISYDWSVLGGSSVVSGTVTLDSSAAAGTGFTLGTIQVTDTDSNASLARGTGDAGDDEGRGNRGRGDDNRGRGNDNRGGNGRMS